MRTRISIALLASVALATPIWAWRAQTQEPAYAHRIAELSQRCEYGTLTIAFSKSERNSCAVAFEVDLGPDQSLRFTASGREQDILEAVSESVWDADLLDEDGDAVATALLADIQRLPDRRPSASVALSVLGQYGWEVFQVDDRSASGNVSSVVYHVRRSYTLKS